MTRKLDHVPYWAYCLVVSLTGLVCFFLGRIS